jgi:hypothetical protein
MELRRVVVLGALLAVAPIAGCGEGSSGEDGGASSAVERQNDQAQREYQACTEQAEELAETEGADAGSEHLEQCVDNLANETLVEE